MINNIKRAFRAYSKVPFAFAWASFIAVIMYALCAFAALGVFLIYFMAVSGFNHYVFDDPFTIGAVFIIGLLLKLLASGVNAALAEAYSDALNGKRATIREFYFKALKSAASSYGITIIRDIVWIIFMAPVLALYIFALKGVQYIEIIIGIYGIFITWLIHMLFTPALLSCALANTGIFSSLKQGFQVIRTGHVNFAGAYILFAITWLLNLIPIVQIVSIFVLYPITYGTLITFVEGTSE